MEKEKITFRIDQNTKTRLDQLLLMENEKASKLGTRSVDRTSIINQAIDALYLSRMEETNGDPMTERLMVAVDRCLQKNLKILIESLNANRYDTMMILEYQRLLCKGLRIDNAKDGLEKLLYTEMPWDVEIPKKVERNIAMKEKRNDQNQ